MPVLLPFSAFAPIVYFSFFLPFEKTRKLRFALERNVSSDLEWSRRLKLSLKEE